MHPVRYKYSTGTLWRDRGVTKYPAGEVANVCHETKRTVSYSADHFHHIHCIWPKCENARCTPCSSEYERLQESCILNFYQVCRNSLINVCSWVDLFLYEGWNFNFGNAAVTFDTAHLQSSYFHRPSMYSPKLCRTRSQWWGSRMMPLAAPVLLMVWTERSSVEGLNPPCNCPIRQCCRTASLVQSSVTLLLFCPCLPQF